MGTLIQSINSTPSANFVIPVASTETVSEEEEYFSMYLFTNGAEKIFGGPSGLDSALGINTTDVVTKPEQKPEQDQDNQGDITDKPDISDAEKFYSDIEKAAPFSFSEEKARETEFSDMYVTSAANRYALSESEKETLTYEEYVTKCQNNLKELESDTSAVRVPIGAGELPLLMNEILRVISEGGSLKDVLLKQAEKHEQNGDLSNTDLFWINPETGSVIGAYKYERTTAEGEWKTLFKDDKAVLSMADDLESFIRYVAFALESDNPEKIKEFLEHLKNKQAYADYNRFILDIKSTEDINKIKELIISSLTAAGVLGSSDEESGDQGDTVPNPDVNPGENISELTLEKEFAELLEIVANR